jgi:hypothetical protein
MLKKILSLFKKPEPQEIPQEKLKIWGVLQGPYSRQEVGDPYVPDGLNYMVLCKASYKKEVFDREFWFETLDEARAMVDHFKSNIEPMELNVYG